MTIVDTDVTTGMAYHSTSPSMAIIKINVG